MLKLLIILCITALQCTTIKAETDIRPTFVCEQDGYYGCIFNNLYLTKEYPNFTPTANNNRTQLEIQQVSVKSVSMEVVTSDFCNAFPNLRALDLGELSIKEIQRNAFKNCSKLEVLSLHNNSLTSLDLDIFVNNKNLKALHLNNNPITYLDVEIFRNSKQLKTVSLTNTKLLEIDIEKLLVYTSLNELILKSTHLSCKRSKEIEIIARKKDVYMQSSGCLQDEQYFKEIMEVKSSDLLLNAKIDFVYRELLKLNGRPKYVYPTENYGEGEYSSTTYYYDHSGEHSSSIDDYDFEGSSTENYDQDSTYTVSLELLIGAFMVVGCLVVLLIIACACCIKARCELKRSNQYHTLNE